MTSTAAFVEWFHAKQGEEKTFLELCEAKRRRDLASAECLQVQLRDAKDNRLRAEIRLEAACQMEGVGHG